MFRPILEADNYLVAHDRVSIRIPGRVHPSDAWLIVDGKHEGTCQRQVWYRYQGSPQTNERSAEVLRAMDMGNLMEEQEARYLKGAGKLIAQRQKVSKPHPVDPKVIVTGEIDFVYRTDPVVIGEFKTSHGPYFKMNVLDDETGYPYLSHLFQVMLYLDLFGNAREGIITYLDTGTKYRREHRVLLESDHPVVNGMLDPRISLNSLYENFLVTLQSVKTGALPAPSYQPVFNPERADDMLQSKRISKTQYKKWVQGLPVGDWQCQECPFKELCLGDAKTI